MRRLALALAAVALMAAGGTHHATHAGTHVSILNASYAPAHIDVLAGDTVMWMNDSVRPHTVTADDGTWDSDELLAGEHFSRRLDTPGSVAYFCRLHPFMRGTVEVHQVLLTAPTEAGAPGKPFTLRGRAAVDPGSAVTIEASAGGAYAPVGTAMTDADGAFHLALTPTTTATYRAVAAGVTSPPVRLDVVDRRVAASARTRGRRVRVSTTVTPGTPGATVVLQLRLRHRFGWWPVARARLDRHSRARFAVRLRRRVPARVALTLADGATVLAVSRTLRVGVKASRP